ncbi:MAG: class I SAM-dependent methyltransferase [Desulfovermiculus sp.]
MPTVPVVMGRGSPWARTTALANELRLPLAAWAGEQALYLEVLRDEIRLQGRIPGESAKNVRPVRSDLGTLHASPSQSNRRWVPLYRAVLGRKKADQRLILDVTGGTGRDAWLLAAFGCFLVVVEREAVVFALLRDGVARAGVEEQSIARRMRLIYAQAEEVLSGMKEQPQMTACGGPPLPRPHVVYMDPFFSSQRKQKVASRRTMQVLRYVAKEQSPDQGLEILDLALHVARERVVVKRPRKSAPLQSRQGRMTHSIQGRGCRFDVYQR